jgi:hypothetical protein
MKPRPSPLLEGLSRCARGVARVAGGTGAGDSVRARRAQAGRARAGRAHQGAARPSQSPGGPSCGGAGPRPLPSTVAAQHHRHNCTPGLSMLRSRGPLIRRGLAHCGPAFPARAAGGARTGRWGASGSYSLVASTYRSLPLYNMRYISWAKPAVRAAGTRGPPGTAESRRGGWPCDGGARRAAAANCRQGAPARWRQARYTVFRCV